MSRVTSRELVVVSLQYAPSRLMSVLRILIALPELSYRIDYGERHMKNLFVSADDVGRRLS